MHYVNEKYDGKTIFWLMATFFSYVFFTLFSNICFPFMVGFVLAYISVPIVNFLSKYVNRSIISLTFAMFSLFVFIMAAMEIIPRMKEYLVLLSDRLPTYYSQLLMFLNDTSAYINIDPLQSEIVNLKSEIQKYLDQKIYILTSILGKIASKRDAIASFLSFFVIMPISFYYFLKDWDVMTRCVYRCIPNRNKNLFVEITFVIRKALGDFFRGQFCVVAISSVYYLILLGAIGVESFVSLGVLSGLFSFIPFIGALFSCLLVIFVSVPILTITKMYLIFTIYLIGQVIEGYVLSPTFVGKKTGLHPLWILFSFFAGIQLNGVIGVLIAIPFAAVLRSLINFMMNKFKASQSYKQ